MAETKIRRAGADYADDLASLYPQVFPDEDLTGIVAALLPLKDEVLSLGAFENDRLVGHVMFSYCDTEPRARRGGLLGPLAVHPEKQREGIGRALIAAGFAAMASQGVSEVFVLGDPGYYGRFGFEPSREVAAPYALPEDWADAWQVVRLGPGDAVPAGSLILPDPWMDPALWRP